jgi:arylsulfatase A-like enzyme
MPGVIASYHLNAAQDAYIRYGTNRTTGHERAWFVQHGDELVDTMAAPFGPDVVGLVETDVTNGVVGDHGGHNRLIQQIPRIFAGPGVVSKDPNREMRLVDVTPTVLDLMEIEYRPADFEGKAVKLP